MRKIIHILIKLKWIGLIGLLGTILGNDFLKRFWLFFLFGLIEIFSNLPAFYQSIEQLISYPLMCFKYRSHLPSRDSYVSSSEYILPFEGEWSVVNGGVTKENSHSWGIWPQRYAYDFLIIDDENKTHSECGKNPEDYYCYAKNIIAPADGRVVYAMDKYPNSEVYGNGTVDCRAKDIRGNFITIMHNESEYSTIAHIMPGSIAVKSGQKVVQGQIIAKCGNTGNTSEPHIHYQLNDGKSFFASAGLPIRFKNVLSSKEGKLFPEEYIEKGQKVQNS